MPNQPVPDHTLSDVYTPPLSTTEAPLADKSPRPRHSAMLAFSVGTFALTCMLSTMRDVGRWLPIIGFGICTLLAFGGAASATRDLFRRRLERRPPLAIAGNVLSLFGNLAMLAVGALATFLSMFGFARGRQIRRFGRPVFARVVPGGSWARTKVSIAALSEVPNGVAAQWRENARTEHASVAAFARLTLDLMALGAPPHLISASNADAIDEIRHAELCFSLAGSIDGEKKDPAPFPQPRRARLLPPTRTMGLAMLAVDSLIDGALHEGVSARIIAKLAKSSDIPAIRGVLKELAADEGRHSAHGWDVVEWCLAEGGRPVASALLGATRTLPARLTSSLPKPAVDGSWERWGIHGAALEQQEYAAARAALVTRVHALLGAAVRAA
jgi:hypothetical protein